MSFSVQDIVELFLLVHIQISHQLVENLLYDVTEDVTFSGSSFSTTIVGARSQCALLCNYEDTCKAASVTPLADNQLQCELYDSPGTTVNTPGASVMKPPFKCPPSYTQWADNGHCYLYVTTTMTWPAARDHCTNSAPGAYLAGIQTQAEHDFIIALVSSQTVWVGGMRTSGGGQYDIYWTSTGDQVGASFDKWYPSEPDNVNGHCTLIIFGYWWDEDCTGRNEKFVCEFA